jgi:hypothetical protein
LLFFFGGSQTAKNRGQDDFSVDAEGQLPGKKQPEAVSTGGIYSFEGLQLEVRQNEENKLELFERPF